GRRRIGGGRTREEQHHEYDTHDCRGCDMSGTSAPAPRTGAKQWWGLAVLVIPSTLLFMMLTILFLAAPNLATDLNPSSAQLLWILDIYGFVMAGFLVAMGVLGDRVGKRRLMVIGAVLFAVVSIAAA